MVFGAINPQAVNVRSSTPGKLGHRVQLCAPSADELRSAHGDRCGYRHLRTASMDNGTQAQDC
jgi:hypothetical protein